MPEDKAAELEKTADQMKAFSHPLRMRLYRLLQDQGRATASMLARQTGESSGQTSYHLRQLAKYGFVVEAAPSGSGRQRWWQAQSFAFEGGTDAPAGVVQGLQEWTVDTVAQDLRQATTREEPDAAWADAGTVTSHTQWMTAEELAAMTEEMLEVLHRHADSAIRSREGLEKEPSGRSAHADERRVRVFLHSFSLPTSG